MPMGYCDACAKLVAITPRGQRFGERAANWYPVDHRGFRHDCSSLARLDEDRVVCPRCGPVDDLTTLTTEDPCPGVKKAL